MTNANVFPFEYTESTNPFLRALQVGFWIAYSPSIWYKKIRTIRENLPQNFCLAEFEWKELWSPAGWRLLLTPLLFLPIIIFLIALLWSWFEPWHVVTFQMALLGACAALSTGILMSAFISFNGGVIFGVTIGLTFAFCPASSPYLYFFVALSAGFAGNVMRRHLQNYFPIRINPRKLGATLIWLSLIACFIIVGAAIADELFFQNELNVNDPNHQALTSQLTIADGILVGISFLLMLGPRCRYRLQPLYASLPVMASALLLTFGMHYTAFLNTDLFFLLAGLNYGILFTLIFGLAFSIAYATGWTRPGIYLGSILAGSLWVPIAIFVVKGFVYTPLFFVLTPLAVLAGLLVHLWRPILLYPFSILYNLILFSWDRERLPGKSSLLKYHPAFWDEENYSVWPNLNQHLVFVSQYDQSLAYQVMASLVFSRQRQAALDAYLDFCVQWIVGQDQIPDLSITVDPMRRWPMNPSDLELAQRFLNNARDAHIAETQTTSLNVRTSLAMVRDRIIELERDLRSSPQFYTERLVIITNHWHKLITARLDELARSAETSKEIDNPYVYGVPIKKNAGVFVGRDEIFAQIEHLLLAPLRPPLFLYGQRRMGKTSLLINLTGALPSTILPLFVDCQYLGGSKSYAEFFYNLVSQMIKSASRQYIELPKLPIENLPLGSPFLAFNQWLDWVENLLQARKQTGLIIFDEFSALEQIFGNANLVPDDFLMLLRNIIQHRDHFRVMISGSHTIHESDQWASYLINMQTIKISYLKESEARVLIEKPISGFPLSYQAETVGKILELTRGHPALIQILCYELVERKNSQPVSERFLATAEDLESVVSSALGYGAFYFEDIHTQLTRDALRMLGMLAEKGSFSWIAAEEWQAAFPTNFEQNLHLLLDRDLVEPIFQNSYRFQVELVRRWVQQRAQSGMLPT